MMIIKRGLILSTHQAMYIIDTMNMRSTRAPAATPYTHIFSFPSVEEEARQSVCLNFSTPTTTVKTTSVSGDPSYIQPHIISTHSAVCSMNPVEEGSDKQKAQLNFLLSSSIDLIK